MRSSIVSRGTSRGIVLLLAAVALPAAYLGYLLSVVPVLVEPTTLRPISATYLSVYLLVLAEIGVVLAGGWVWGLRIAPLLVVVVLLGRPLILPIRSVGLLGQVVSPFVFMVVLSTLEAAIRFPDRAGRYLFVEAAGGTALGFGLAHFVLGLCLQVYVRRLYWLDGSLPGVILFAMIYALNGFGLVATGGLPVVLWSRDRLVTPGLLTIGWVLWGVYGISTRSGIPLSEFSGIQWIALQPHPDYLHQWTMLLVGILFLTGCELAIRRSWYRVRGRVRGG